MRSIVIYEEDGNLRLKDFPLTVPIDVGAIDFYVGRAAKTQVQVFLILKDRDLGLHEVVELHESTNASGRPVFRVPLTYSLRIDKSRVEMRLMILEVESQTQIMSNPVNVILSTEQYRLARETAVVNELGKSIKAYYEAIRQALEEIVEKGENVE